MFTDYFSIGWQHILAWGAWDHLLFILAIAAIYTTKDWRQVLVLVTAFTIGHSLTLVLSTFHLIQFSSHWIEFLIPCTIAFTGLSNLTVKKFNPKSIQLNYYLALFFGCIHGLGFANGLSSLLGKETNVLLPLLGFNLGLEAGQIIVVIVLLMIAWLALNVFKVNRREYVVFFSGGAFLTGLQMALERWPGLS